MSGQDRNGVQDVAAAVQDNGAGREWHTDGREQLPVEAPLGRVAGHLKCEHGRYEPTFGAIKGCGVGSPEALH
jgi:hypothetical protein